jgi:uncharacterized membrane protein
VSTKAQATSRLAFIDVLRGVGVVLMIQLHTSHGWVRPELRAGGLWQTTQFWGGLAAPIFVMLAGVSLGLRMARAHARGQLPHYGLELRRALQLVVLGYLLRLQMWFIDAGGFARPDAYLAQALLLAAYGLAFFALSQERLGSIALAACACGATALFGLGLFQVAIHAPDRLTGLLRVDVLQCIGGSLVLVIVVAAAHRRGFRVRRYYAFAAVVAAFVAAWTRTWVPGPLPPAIAGYLGQWPAEPGKSVVGLFPLFPWSAYAFAGTAFGLGWARAARPERADVLDSQSGPTRFFPWGQSDRITRSVVLLALGAVCVALATRESTDAVHALLERWAWLTQPARVTQRVAWVLALAGVCAAVRAWIPILVAPLETIGRTSLLVYWVHLEFAFGAASSAFSRSLDFAAWAIGTLGLVLAMWLVAQIRLGLRVRPGTAGDESGARERTTSAHG